MSREDILFVVQVASAVGVGVAIIALLLTWRTHSERAKFDMIDGMYGLCGKLGAYLLDDWKLSHLFCIDAIEYERTRDEIARQTSKDSRSEFRRREMLFAIQVFIAYEQILYQWTYSSGFLYPERKKFLHDMVEYFEDRFLMNPRLQAFFESDPSGRSLHMESWSAERYARILAEHSKLPNRPLPDRIGPFSDND